MPFERDPRVIDWFERTLAHPVGRTRRRAVELLQDVDTDLRPFWLERALRDSDPQVAAAAVLVTTVVALKSDDPLLELMESDAFSGQDSPDLEWEWEYAIRMCRDAFVPAAVMLVWLREDDDCVAKRIALMKAFPGEVPPEDAVPVIVSKCSVTRFTRSARTMAEALKWHAQGRPRYRES